MGFFRSLLRLVILALTVYGAYWLVVERYKLVEVDWTTLKADAQYSFFTMMYASSSTSGLQDYVPSWFVNLLLAQTGYMDCLRFRARRPPCWPTDKIRITHYTLPIDSQRFTEHYLRPNEPYRVFSIEGYLADVVSPSTLLSKLSFFNSTAQVSADGDKSTSATAESATGDQTPALLWYKQARCTAQTPDEYRLLDVRSFRSLLESASGRSEVEEDKSAASEMNWNVKWRVPSATLTRRTRSALLGEEPLLTAEPRFFNTLPGDVKLRNGDEYLLVDSIAMSHYILPNSFAYYAFEPRTVFQLETELRLRYDGRTTTEESKPSAARKLLESACTHDKHLTVYEQLYGCRHVVLYPVTACSSPSDSVDSSGQSMQGGAPQPITITMMPRHILYFNASHYNAWSYPFTRPCSNATLSIGHLRTFRIDF